MAVVYEKGLENRVTNILDLARNMFKTGISQGHEYRIEWDWKNGS